MLFKRQSKINNKLISQNPTQYPPSSHNAIVETDTTKHFVIPNTPLINKKKTTLPFHVQLPNTTVFNSTNKGNI